VPGGAAIGRQPHLAIGQDEAGVFGCHHHVTGQHQRHAAARGHTLDRRNDRLGEAAQRFDPEVKGIQVASLGMQIGLAQVGQALQIAAGAEMPLRPGEDHCSHLGVGFGHVERLDPGGIHLGRQRVAASGARQGQDQGVALAFSEQFSVHGKW